MRRLVELFLLFPMAAFSVTVSDIAQMTRAEAEDLPPCEVEGVITCVFAWQTNSFTLADTDDPDGPAVYVGGDLSGWPKPVVAGGNHRFAPGEVVRIGGRVLPLMLEPGIAAEAIRVTGRRVLSAPPDVRLADLRTGRYNNRRVCVTGVLRDHRVELAKGGDSVTVLTLGMIDGTLRVSLRGAWEDLAEFRDAELSIDGVCLPSYNARAEFLSPEVEASDREAIHVVPSGAPARPLTETTRRPLGVLAWSPTGNDGHLRTLDGEVTYVSRADRFFVLQAATAVRVNLPAGDLPSVGDRVVAEGFPTLADDCGVLDAGRFRTCGAVSPRRVPEPLAGDRLERFLQAGESGEFDCHYRLVKVSGRALGVERLPNGETEITLAIGSHRLSARLAADAGELPGGLEDKPPVVAAGVLKVRYEGVSSAGRVLAIEGFTLLLRDAADLVVLSDSASVRRRLARLATRLGLFALLPLAALALLLGLRVVRQRERGRAVAEDRRRMAEELHDTIAQYLSGARLLLFSVQAEAPALSEAARGAAKMAGDILETARRELRDKILNLQSDELMLRPLAVLLRGLAAKANATGGARVRTLLRGLPDEMPAQTKNDILAMVQEAVTNAVRHGHAHRIAIVADPLPPKGYALSILNDGAPFDAAAALGPETGHFGLSSLRERARRNGFALTFGMRKGWTSVRLERKEA